LLMSVPLVRVTGVEPVRQWRLILSQLGLPVPPYSHGCIYWSGVEESNLYNDFRRIMSYPLNERQNW